MKTGTSCKIRFFVSIILREVPVYRKNNLIVIISFLTCLDLLQNPALFQL